MINFKHVDELDGISFFYGKRDITIRVLPADNIVSQPVGVYDKDHNVIKIYKILEENDIIGYEHTLVHELSHVCMSGFLSQPDPILIDLEVVAELTADFLPGIIDDINAELSLKKYDFEDDDVDETLEEFHKEDMEGEECI